MSAVPQFDTLKLAQSLQAGGFSPQQAEATAHALADATSSAEITTKADLTQTEQRLTTKIDLLEKSMTIRLGGMIVFAVCVLMAAIRHFPAH